MDMMCGNHVDGNERTDDEAAQRALFGIRRMELIHLIEGEKRGGPDDTSGITFIKTPTSTVVVDSGSEAIRNIFQERMREAGIKMEKVNVLVTTSVDPIHNANDKLFIHALQHLRKDEWSKVPVRGRRKISINTKVHWIDRYLRLEVLPFPGSGSMVLILHLPGREEHIEPSTKHLAGKVIGICGMAVPSADDPEVAEALGNVRAAGPSERPSTISTMEDLFGYCDHIIPAYGPMFWTRE